MNASDDLFKAKPSSLLHTIAEHFLRDAQDFSVRFDALWEYGALMRKDGRTKSFVDLMMAAECVLKAHALLGLKSRPVEDAYREVRACSHDIRRLSTVASYMADRTIYERLAAKLENLQVHLRYSFEAYETFFPAWKGRSNADLSYSATIGDNAWVLAIRADVQELIESIQREFSGLVEGDLEKLLQGEADLRQFIDEIIKTKPGGR